MKKKWLWITGIVAGFIVTVEAAAFFAGDPVRRYIEDEFDGLLKGYTVRIDKVSIHPLRLAVDFKNVSIYQKANSTPPIAEVPSIRGGLHWLELFTAHVVADAEMDHPAFYIDLEKLKHEVTKPPAEKESWQQTIEAISPLTVNEFRIKTGNVTYVEPGVSKPFKVTGINITARNIRNVRSPARIYPSDFDIEAVFPGSGRLKIDGKADFLLEPYAGLTAAVHLDGFDLAQLREIAERFHITMTKGTLSTETFIEFSPNRKMLTIKDLTLKDPEIDLIYLGPSPQKAPPKKLPVEINAEKVRIVNGNFGLVNKTKKPPYRAFIDHTDIDFTNFSNEFTRGPGELAAKGKFMGSGETTARATFRTEANGPDFNLSVAIKNTKMTDMNNVFKAYGKFDVAAGFFSFYSELTVKGDRIAGYVKPLFRDMKVYDKRKDEDKSAFKKLYEKVVGGAAKLLKNRPRDAVATKTPISGKVEKPHAGTWETLGNLLENAFIHAILPGFEENIK